MLLVTVCGAKEARPGQPFFPLTVDYIEKTYAAGKIPGGFFKREGKLRDHEVLTSRIIDRPCRPLFPEGYMAEDAGHRDRNVGRPSQPIGYLGPHRRLSRHQYFASSMGRSYRGRSCRAQRRQTDRQPNVRRTRRK